MAYHPYVSVICIHSGVRRYSYVIPESFEHGRVWSWLTAGPLERLNLLHCVALQEASELVRTKEALACRHRPLRALAAKALDRVGVHPDSLRRFLEGVAKGEWVGNHTRFTSKPPALPLNEKIPMVGATAEAFLGRGWHVGEGQGRWTSATTAEIFFSRLQEDVENCVLQICGHPLRAGDKVEFKLNSLSIKRTLKGGDAVVSMELPAQQIFRLTITVKAPTSPMKLGISKDNRVLGYWLSWLQVLSKNPSN